MNSLYLKALNTQHLYRKGAHSGLTGIMRGLIVCLFLGLPFGSLYAQTGPGGVGNATGGIGQPTNKFWLRADAGVFTDAGTTPAANGGSVQQWNDQSGNNNHGTQSNNQNKPTFTTGVLGGRPVLRFNRDQIVLPATLNTNTGFPMNFFAVTVNTTNPRGLFDSAPLTNGVFRFFNDGQFGPGANNTVEVWQTNPVLPYTLNASGSVAGISGRRDAANRRVLTTYLNGAQTGNATGTAPGTGTPTDPVVFSNPRIGTINHTTTSNVGNGDSPFAGDLAEMIYYASPLNEAQRIIVENYLGAKYGISLGATDYYAHANTATFNEGVIGIGTSDGTAANSHTYSIAGGLYLTGIASTMTSANSYVIAGNDNTPHGSVSTFASSTAIYRWAREYWVESTGAKPNITLGFNFADAGMGLPSINPLDYMLIYRPDASSAYSIASTSLTINGTLVTFSLPGTNLASGFYTIAWRNYVTTLYSYNTNCNGGNCNWELASSWTIDPSGAFSVSPQLPTAATNVVILPNANVTVTTNLRTANMLTIQSDGALNLGVTTGHIFNGLDGAGTLRISGAAAATAVFPTVGTNLFITTAGSTVEYYGATSYRLPANIPSYRNLVFSGGGTKSLNVNTLVNEKLTVATSTVFQATNFDLTVTGTTTVDGTLGDNSNSGTNTNTYNGAVTVSATGTINLEQGGNVFNNTLTILGTVRDNNMLGTNIFNSDVLVTSIGTFDLEQGSHTFNGTTTVNAGGTLRESSGNGIESFNDLIISGVLENPINSAVTIRGNLTVNNTATITSGSGSYILTGTNKNIDGNMNSFTLQNVVVNGTYTNSIPALIINTGTVNAGGKFTNASSIVPVTYTGFNISRRFTSGYNHIAATGTGNSIQSTAAGNLSFRLNNAGAAYAVRTGDFNPSTNSAIVRFDIGVTSPGDVANAATILLGSNFTDDATRNAAAARLQIGFSSAANNAFTVGVPDATSATSGILSNSRAVFWAVNNSGASMNYIAPNNAIITLPTATSHLWIGTTQIGGNLGVQNAAALISDVKIVYDNGTAGTVVINNLIINPISNILLTTGSVGPFCVSPLAGSSTFNVNFSMPAIATASTHFNSGNTFTVQLSNPTGAFTSPTTLGTLTTTLLSGSIPVSIPAGTASGNNYRIRVISSSPGLVSNDNGSDIVVRLYQIRNSDNSPQQTLTVGNPTSGVPVNVVGPAPITSYSWGYRDVSGGSIKKFIGCDCYPGTSTYTPNPADFPGKGTYFLVATIVTPTCTIISNEIPVAVNCPSNGVNMITNPDFSAGNTGFTSQYTLVTQPATKCNGASVPCPMFPEGTYAIGTNPRFYHTNFCDFDIYPPPASLSRGNMLIANAATNGSLDVWAQNLVVEKNTDYVFTFWAVNLNNVSPLQFGVYINCFQIGIPVSNAASSPCEWMKYSIQWNSGNNTNIKLSVRNISVNAAGNDITMDDFSFYKCTDAPTFSPTYPYKWRGLTSEWNKADNWGNCVPPTCADSVEIVPGTPFQPIITSSMTAAAKHITIQSGASLTLNTNASLAVCGNILNYGQIVADPTSTVTFQDNGNPQWISGNFSGTSQFGNVVINKTTSTDAFRFDSNADILGNFTVTRGAVNANGGYIRIRRDFSIATTGSFTHGNGTIEFNGLVNQNFVNNSTAPSGEFYNLHMNQNAPSNLLTPGGSNGSIIVNNNLILTSGKIYPSGTTTYEVNVKNSNPSAIMPGSGNTNYTNSYIVTIPTATPRLTLKRAIRTSGYPATFTYDFPVGDGAYSELIRFEITENSKVNQLTASFDRADAPQGSGFPLPENSPSTVVYTNPCQGGFWRVNADVNAAQSKSTFYNVEIFPLAFSCTGPDTKRTVVKRTNSSSAWTLDNSNYISSTKRVGMSGFSEYTWGTGYDPLPVRMLSFEGRLNKDITNLVWRTASESGSDFFIVQRSTDGKNFTYIGRVDAKGNSSKIVEYTFTDYQPVVGINYYRLLQRDKDGSQTYSNVISVNLDKTEDISVYPNPAESTFNVAIPATSGEHLNIQMVDMLGRIVHADYFEFKGEIYTVDKQLAQGVYVLTVTTKTKTYTRKVVIE